jgi:hypothetical protein
MFKKIKQLSITLVAVLTMSVPMLVPVTVHAQNDIQKGLCTGLNTASGTTDSCTGDSDSANQSLNSIITTVINVFSMVVGFVSVIMIIIGGFKYITSNGDSGNVTGAKNTIMYALIGLVVVALAQIIVRFVLAKATA